MNSKQDLYSVLSPITLVCRVSGILPLWLKGQTGERKYSTSNILIIYNMTVLALSTTGLSMWMWKAKETVKELQNGSVITASFDAEFKLSAWSLVVMIASAILTRTQVVLLFQAIGEVIANAIDTLSSQDTTLRRLGTRMDYATSLKQNYMRLGVTTSVTIVLCAYDFILHSYFNLRYPLLWAAWMYTNVIRIVDTCLFSELLFATQQRFAAINEHLTNMIREQKQTEYLSHRGITFHERLRLIAMTHGALYEAAHTIKKKFGLNMIIGAVCALRTLTIDTCSIIQEIKDHIDVRWMHTLGCLNRAMISCAHIVYLVIAYNLAQNQARLTGKVIHKIQMIDGDMPFNTMLQSLSLQLYHEKIDLTAAGVFSLDATLLQSIVGAVTTFLVILMQFDTLTPDS